MKALRLDDSPGWPIADSALAEAADLHTVLTELALSS